MTSTEFCTLTMCEYDVAATLSKTLNLAPVPRAGGSVTTDPVRVSRKIIFPSWMAFESCRAEPAGTEPVLRRDQRIEDTPLHCYLEEQEREGERPLPKITIMATGKLRAPSRGSPSWTLYTGPGPTRSTPRW